MSEKREQAQGGRRNFLKGVVAVGGAATVVAATGAAVAESRSNGTVAGPEQPKSKGYRMTPHIREYYEKARF